MTNEELGKKLDAVESELRKLTKDRSSEGKGKAAGRGEYLQWMIAGLIGAALSLTWFISVAKDSFEFVKAAHDITKQQAEESREAIKVREQRISDLAEKANRENEALEQSRKENTSIKTEKAVLEKVVEDLKKGIPNSQVLSNALAEMKSHNERLNMEIANNRRSIMEAAPDLEELRGKRVRVTFAAGHTNGVKQLEEALKRAGLSVTMKNGYTFGDGLYLKTGNMTVLSKKSMRDASKELALEITRVSGRPCFTDDYPVDRDFDFEVMFPKE